MTGASSDTGGVKPMNLGGRLVRVTERLHGMTNEERAWRAQYLKDQILSHNEPRFVPEYWAARLNPIRKFYRFPMDRIEKVLTPTIGARKAEIIRYFGGKFFVLAAFIYAARYYFKYNTNDWTARSGWSVQENRDIAYPGDPGFPKPSGKTKPQDFCEKGFSKSPI